MIHFLPYIQFSPTQLVKIGNSVIYMAERVPDLSKTKLLKLLYILDEISIKKCGIPVLNLKYKVWKFGPVSEELFIDLSSDPVLLQNYIHHDFEGQIIVRKKEFNDDEFSENEIEFMDFVVDNFGTKSAKELVLYTHRANAPWYITAKENAVLELLVNEQINNTEFVIDMSLLVSHDERKLNIYREYLKSH